MHEGYFGESEAITFAQLNSELPYVQSSFIHQKFSVLINCEYPKRVNGFIEHVLWQQFQNMSQRLDSCLFLTRCPQSLSEDNELQVGQKVNETLERQGLTIGGLTRVIQSERTGLAQVGEIVSQVDQTEVLQGLGVMMYYGDTKYNEETKIAKSEAGPYKAEEAELVHNLIYHCITGLASI